MIGLLKGFKFEHEEVGRGEICQIQAKLKSSFLRRKETFFRHIKAGRILDLLTVYFKASLSRAAN